MWVDRSDIQGLVVSGYAAQPASALVELRFGPDQGARARNFLRRLLPFVSSASRRERFERCRIQVAFSASGLERLGLPESTLSGFSPEFIAGMADRARLLGDVGEDAPPAWDFGGPNRSIEALVLVYAPDVGTREQKLDEICEWIEKAELDYDWTETFLDVDRREHFGFRTGASSPHYRGLSSWRRRRIPLGELLLGYATADGRRLPSPTAPRPRSTRNLRLRHDGQVDLGRNGTYLVVRKLEQRVDAFWERMRELARETGGRLGDERALASKLVGRAPDGTPLAGCPLGAHARRANPGPELDPSPRTHQILRRGRLYQQGGERGLMFVALNADLAEQFEFVQRNFVNDPKFGGLRDERDPLLGSDDGGERRFTLQGDGIRTRLTLPRFVRLRGGGYFFLPSLSALAYLTEAGRGDGT
jgi:deferrochelatase/peroxidase EfeB